MDGTGDVAARRICVFCGANSGGHPSYGEAADELGRILAEEKLDLVYGGACIGLMGIVADAVLRTGGRAVGVVPTLLPEGKVHRGLTETYMVATPNVAENRADLLDEWDGVHSAVVGEYLLSTVELLREPLPGLTEWTLPLADRVLLAATYCRTNLTMRQIAPLFGVSVTAAHRVIERLTPLLGKAPARRPGPDAVLIVDGTLVPVRDRQVAAVSKNYRHSVNPQVLIEADTRLVLAVGDPLPGNHNDCTAYTASGIDKTAGQATVMADGGYQGTGLLMPHRRQPGQQRLPAWKERDNTAHRRIRARIEHVLAAMKCWKLLRDCRRRGHSVHHTALAIAHMHNLTLTC